MCVCPPAAVYPMAPANSEGCVMLPHALNRRHNRATSGPCSSDSDLASEFDVYKLWKWFYHTSWSLPRVTSRLLCGIDRASGIGLRDAFRRLAGVLPHHWPIPPACDERPKEGSGPYFAVPCAPLIRHHRLLRNLFPRRAPIGGCDSSTYLHPFNARTIALCAMPGFLFSNINE